MKLEKEDKDLILEAEKLLKEDKNNKSGSACMILAPEGMVYKGLSLSTMSASVCASTTALGSLITAGKDTIKTLVTVNKKGIIYPLCGRCRELFYELINNDPWVIVSRSEKVRLRTLLPYAWFDVGKKLFKQKG